MTTIARLREENERLNERQSVLETALTTLNERWDAQTAAVREQALDLAAADRKLYRLQQDVSRSSAKAWKNCSATSRG